MKSQELYQAITDQFVAELESAKAKGETLPWLKPWENSSTTDGYLPYNGHRNNQYHGVNILLLWRASQYYGSNAWLTFKQAREMGGTVRKGSHGHKVVFFKINQYPTSDKDDDGNTIMRKVPLIRQYTVFNSEQCDGIELKPIEEITDLEGYAWFLAQQNNIELHHGGNRAFYRHQGSRQTPDTGFINMPPPKSFNGEHTYDATLLHEITHWTGHDKRCNRQFGKRFGDDAYAFEELVAEIGSAFLCARYNIVGEQQHTAYLQSWIRVLKADNRAIFTAASQAQKAVESLTHVTQADVDTSELNELTGLRTRLANSMPNPLTVKLS